MEKEILNYLFEKGYLNIDKIMDEYASSNGNYTTYTLLNAVDEVMKI